MKVLVTGGAGFIGSHTVQTLLTQGHSVVVLDNLYSGKTANLENWPVELVEGDIRDQRACEQALTGVDAVIHLAAQISVIQSIKDPATTHAINIDGTLNLLEGARRHGVKNFVFASSCAVYGDARELPIDEKTAASPLSPYAVSKLTGEHYCRMYREIYGLNVGVFRFFNIFGPKQDDSSPYASVIAIFAKRLLQEIAVTIYGTGEQTRDFLFVKDVAGALAFAAAHAAKLPAPSYNLGSGRQTTVLHLFDLLAKALNKRVPVSHASARPGEILHSLGNASLFREAAAQAGYRYEPGAFEPALRETAAWYASRWEE